MGDGSASLIPSPPPVGLSPSATTRSRIQGRWALPSDSRGPAVHGGDGNGWICDQCQASIDEVKAVILHLGSAHGIPSDSVVFCCCRCRLYRSCNHRSVISHYRYCKNKSDIASRGVTEEANLFQCDVCELAFKSKVGRTQHMRWKHPEIYNEKLKVSAAPSKFSEGELRDLAVYEIQLGSTRTINKDLAIKFPHRTVSSISSIRKKANYKAILAEELRRRDVPGASLIASSEHDLPGASASGAGSPRCSPPPETNLRASCSLCDVRSGPSDGAHSLGPSLNTKIKDSSSDFIRLNNDSAWASEIDKALINFLSDSISSNELDGPYSQFVDKLMELLPEIREDAPHANQNKTSNKNKTSNRHSNSNKNKNAKPRCKRARDRRRRHEFYSAQIALQKDFSSGARKVMDGVSFSSLVETHPDLEETYKVYKDKLSPPGPVDLSDLGEIANVSNPNSEIEPFGQAEVQAAIDTLNKSVASGPDSWLDVAAIRKLGAKRLTLIFNIFLLFDRIPIAANKCYSILIPKSPNASTSLNEWRPITVGSLFSRLLAKIVCNRLMLIIPHNSRQKAFIPTEGTANNVFLLKEVINRSRQSLSELNLAFLDISKAFDSIPHEAIWHSLLKAGAPGRLVRLVQNTYATCSTKFRIQGQETPEISILNGVKQGCPLSPFLFNLVLDNLLDFLSRQPYGVDIDTHKINALAFADDLVLISKHKYDMQCLLNIVSSFFSKLCMSLNPNKCETLRFTRAQGVKNVKVDTSEPFFINNTRIKSCSFSASVKYLGVQVNHKGEIIYPRSSLDSTLANIKKAKIRPDQRIRILRDHYLPKLAYALKLSLGPISRLRTFDAVIRKWVLKVLHLPPMPTSFLYMPLRHGGLGLLQLSKIIPYRSFKSLNRMCSSEDRVDAIAASSLLNKYSSLFSAVHVDSNNVDSWLLNYNNSLVNKFCASGWGIDFDPLARGAKTLSWVPLGRTLRGGNYVKALQLYSGNWPCKMHLYRGRTKEMPDKIKCRRCSAPKETVAHILNECIYSHNAIVARHNLVVNKIAEQLNKREHLSVFKEKLFLVNREGLRPDLVVRDNVNSSVAVVEVMVPYDHSTRHLNSRFDFKLSKYNSDSFRDEVAKVLLGPAFDRSAVRVYPVVLGSRGAITSKTLGSLRNLRIVGLSYKLQCCVLGSSLRILSNFRRDREQPRRDLRMRGRRQAGGGGTSNTDGPAGRPPDAP